MIYLDLPKSVYDFVHRKQCVWVMPVKFYLSPQANKAGEFPIRVSISVNGTRYLTTAEYSGRDTFIVHAISMGIYPDIVMKGTGFHIIRPV